MDATLQQSLFASIVNSSDDAIISKTLGGIITSWNRGAEAIFGYAAKELIGKSISILIPDDLIDEENDLVERIKNGEHVDHYETERSKKDGSRIIVSLRISPILDSNGNVVGASKIARDITKSKRIAEALESSERRYRQVLDNMLEGVQIHDFDWRYIYVNDTLVSYSGYARKELLGHTLMEKYPGIEQTNLFKSMQRCMEERVAEHLETEFIFPDGSRGDFELSMQPTSEGLVILSVDRTEQTKAKAKLLKANRLYAFISAINKSIVHIHDEQELLDNACHIAVDTGRFIVASIALVDESNDNLNVVSIRGTETELNGKRKYSGMDYNDPVVRDTPTGRAMRTGQYAVSNEVQHDPAMNFWKAELAASGIKASISLPIKKFGKVVGVFGLHSTIENFFDEEEIDLLLEATGDISFGLENFEKARKQQETEELVLKNEKRFRALIEKSADMKVLATEEGKMLYASPSVEKMLGYKPDEFVQNVAKDLVHPDDLQGFVERRMELLKMPGQSFHWQYRIRHKNGDWIWIENTMTNLLHEPGIMALVNNFRDISERKKAEQRQEFDRNNNLDALINNTNERMWSVDLDFNLITSNLPFDEMTKLISGKVMAKGSNFLSAGFPGEALTRFISYYERAFTGEAFTEIEHTDIPAESWMEISFYPIRKGDDVIGTACHSRDITRQKTWKGSLMNRRGVASTFHAC